MSGSPRKKNPKKPQRVRTLALDSLIQINEKGAFSTTVTAQTYAAHPELSGPDRSLYAILVEGTLDHLLLLDYDLNQVSSRPVEKMRPAVRNLLRMSAFQILFLDRVPDHAAVSEALKVAEEKNLKDLKGFINGVLRALIRRREDLSLPEREEDPQAFLSLNYSCPAWIVRMWFERFGERKTEEMLQAFRADKELTLWVNPKKTDVSALLRYFSDEGIPARRHPAAEDVICCRNLSRIGEDQALRDGAYYVQDFSSILAACPALFRLREMAVSHAEDTAGTAAGAADTADAAQAAGAAQTAAAAQAAGAGALRVIDVCGAPGGKSLFLAAHLPQSVRFSCRDVSAKKTSQIEENAKRLGLTNVEALAQDARVLREEDRGTADLVIADLPCSGLGVIGRKADLRYRVKEEDITALSALQRQILSTAQEYVRPGGYLSYSTCTISEAENEAQAAWFLSRFPFEAVPLKGLPQAVLNEDPQQAPPAHEAAGNAEKAAGSAGKIAGSAAKAAGSAGKGCLQILPAADPYRDGFFMALFRRVKE